MTSVSTWWPWVAIAGSVLVFASMLLIVCRRWCRMLAARRRHSRAGTVELTVGTQAPAAITPAVLCDDVWKPPPYSPAAEPPPAYDSLFHKDAADATQVQLVSGQPLSPATLLPHTDDRLPQLDHSPVTLTAPPTHQPEQSLTAVIHSVPPARCISTPTTVTDSGIRDSSSSLDSTEGGSVRLAQGHVCYVAGGQDNEGFTADVPPGPQAGHVIRDFRSSCNPGTL